jgi:fumarylacetoacetate (FAA) hydrolase
MNKLPLPPVRSLRDFYAFEQHVKTCRAQRGLGMVAEWYLVPVFYFSNPAAILTDGEPVFAPLNCFELDYELEIACVIGTEASNLPEADSAMNCVLGFTVMNDWSARDLQRKEMAVGLGPSKGKDFATSLGLVTPWAELQKHYQNGKLNLTMTASVNGKRYSHGNANQMHYTWPQLLAHASRDTRLLPGDVIGSGTVGTGCILELTPQAVGGWLQPGDTVSLTIDVLGTLTTPIIERPS